MMSQSSLENGCESIKSEKRDFTCCGNRMPKNQFTYISQIIVIYGIIITAIIHLSLQSPNRELWLILLSSSLGYILPSPGLKFVKTSPNNSIPQGIDFVDGKK